MRPATKITPNYRKQIEEIKENNNKKSETLYTNLINLRTNLIPLLDERADTILRRIKVYVNRITDKDERDKFIIDMKNVNVEIGDTEC